MSRQYLEWTETGQPAGIEPEFVRIDVTGMTPAEVDAVRIAGDALQLGTYQRSWHDCRHDEGKPCHPITVEKMV